MVHFKALFTSLSLFLLIFASLTLATIHPAAAATTGVAGAVAQDNHHHQTRQRKQRMNHGSFRGPRKHLLNPAVEHPLQLPKLPV
ncbi:hypothetical protein COLO4_16914 [Corchorus olitorius]|uniref:Uncharacterized protein n=1 Tax=Corchorus olitorius TaxID=93759 RepID=A0A1R3JFD0_9ROSI|nr:hypothetical protein COLO4_16914 [Corchorus olitorius]